MPKKTRKEKIIADYRRRLKLLQRKDVVITEKMEKTEKTEIKQPLPAINTIFEKNDSLVVSYFKDDFKKSLILIVIIIALEFSLYFARIMK